MSAPGILRDAAAWIKQRGWGRLRGNAPDATPVGVRGLDVSLAVCWAVRGGPCRPRDLNEAESDHVAVALDLLERSLGERVVELEERLAGATPADIGQVLRLAARQVDDELREMLR